MRDDDRFGSFEVHTLCVMMIGLEVYKVYKLSVVVTCKSGSLKVYKSFVMVISLEVWKFA